LNTCQTNTEKKTDLPIAAEDAEELMQRLSCSQNRQELFSQLKLQILQNYGLRKFSFFNFNCVIFDKKIKYINMLISAKSVIVQMLKNTKICFRVFIFWKERGLTSAVFIYIVFKKRIVILKH